MSRDPSGIYSYPDGTRGSPGTTIFSARYNTFLDDLAVTLNTKLPINMGGTGADDAAEARDNLDTERAMQQVTNYDTHVFEAGSFWSGVGATAAPTPGSIYHGVCTIDTSSNITLIVRDPGPSDTRSWARRKFLGSWTPWIVEGDQFVAVTGDTMTGDLAINKNAPTLVLNKTSTGQTAGILGQTAGAMRWGINVGDQVPEVGSNQGSDFTIVRANDAGAGLDAPLVINRNTGRAVFLHGVDIRQAGLLNHTTTDTIVFNWVSGVAQHLEYGINLGAGNVLWSAGVCPANGAAYQKLASGIIIQWGSIPSTAGDGIVTFPTAFTTGSWVSVTPLGVGLAGTTLLAFSIEAPTTTGFTLRPRYCLNGGAVGTATQGFNWYAIGY